MSLGYALWGEDEYIFIVSEIIMLGGVIVELSIYALSGWLKGEMKCTEFYDPCFLYFIYCTQPHPFGLETSSSLLHVVVVGPVRCLLSHLHFLSVGRGVSKLGLIYILAITLTMDERQGH